MAKFRVDLYTNPHKDLRNLLFLASMKAGKTNFLDAQEKKELSLVINDLIAALAAHAYAENTYAHPILREKMPEKLHDLDSDHQEQKKSLALLQAQLQAIDKGETDKEQMALGLEFYRLLNRFIAKELLHMNEEEYFMQNAWELCNNKELFAIMFAFKAIHEPDQFGKIKKLAEDNLNTDEQKDMLTIIHTVYGHEVFNTVMATMSGIT